MSADEYKGWSTGYNANIPVIDRHEWQAHPQLGASWDGAVCGKCGAAASNHAIAAGAVPECKTP